MLLRRASWVAVAAIVLVVASGCTAEEEPPVSVRALVGENLAFAAAAAREDASTTVQDLAVSFDAEPSYDSSDWGSSGFLVLAACADSPDVRRATQLHVGVVAFEATTADQRDKARAGGYRDSIGCPKDFER